MSQKKLYGVICIVILMILCCSNSSEKTFRELSWEDYLDKIDGGLLGQMIGVQFGAPTEGLWTGEMIPFDLNDYYSFDRHGLASEDVDPDYRDNFDNWKKLELNGFPENDDVYIEMLFLNSIQQYGLDLTSKQIADDFVRYIPRERVWCANRVAWDNIAKGIYPPESGHPKNGWASDDIDFQIESDLFGLISPGLPKASNAWCWKFGHVMNYGDGVYGGVFVAAMYTAAFIEDDIHKVIEWGLGCIPEKSFYAEMVRDVLKWHSENEDWRDAWQKIYEKWFTTPEGDRANAVDVRVNGAYILMGLLYGEGDFWKTMNISMRCGMDSDCNPSNAVGILGCIKGARNIPEKWKNPMKDVLFNETLKEIYPDQINRKDIVLSIAEIGKNMVQRNDGKFKNNRLYIPVQKPEPVPFEQSCLIWPILGTGSRCSQPANVKVDELKRSRYLLLDSRIIEKTENAKLVVGTVEKHEANPLFGEDKPWEKRFDNLYGNIIYDQEEEIYKCWYSPFIEDLSAKGMSLEDRLNQEYDPPDNREMAICYAISKDGITWKKPELNIVKFGQSKKNNILWRGAGNEDEGAHWGGPHGSGIFKDDRDPDPNRRYKAILKGEILSVAFSADGINWGLPVACPEADVAGDTHNNAFWAPTLGKYVAMTRSWGDMGRQVVRTESEDFDKWTAAEVVLEGMDKYHQTYAMPVFFHGGVYLGLVAIHDQKNDRVQTELTWSPDTKKWFRISPGTALIPCSERELDYDYGCVYTCATPVFLEKEIRLYYGGSDWLHFGWRCGSLCLATMRPDGFAGYIQASTEKPAKITTTEIQYAGQVIQITADVEKGGWIRVSVLDSKGNNVAVAAKIEKSVTDERLMLSDEFNLDVVKLMFELNQTKLYSFNLVNHKDL